MAERECSRSATFSYTLPRRGGADDEARCRTGDRVSTVRHDARPGGGRPAPQVPHAGVPAGTGLHPALHRPGAARARAADRSLRAVRALARLYREPRGRLLEHRLAARRAGRSLLLRVHQRPPRRGHGGTAGAHLALRRRARLEPARVRDRRRRGHARLVQVRRPDRAERIALHADPLGAARARSRLDRGRRRLLRRLAQCAHLCLRLTRRQRLVAGSGAPRAGVGDLRVASPDLRRSAPRRGVDRPAQRAGDPPVAGRGHPAGARDPAAAAAVRGEAGRRRVELVPDRRRHDRHLLAGREPVGARLGPTTRATTDARSAIP